MNLRDIILEAQAQVDTYKYPDLSKFKEALTPVIMELGYSDSTLDDHIDYISFDGSAYADDQALYISTSWSSMGCACSGDVKVPYSVIMAEDPVKAAKLYTSNKKLTEAITAFNAAEKRLEQTRETMRAATEAHYNLLEELK